MTKFSPLSLFSIRLVLKRNGLKLGSGTGFIYQPDGIDRRFLVTNYHVLTAREPKNPTLLLDGYPDSPDEIEFFLLTKPDLKLRNGKICLAAGSSLEWLEHRNRADGVDIVAVPIEFPDDAIVLTQAELSLVEDINFEVGSDLFIIGFPFGFAAGDFLPIWKRGTVATEPGFKPDGLPRFYIDAHAKPGMSGSPVFAMEPRQMLQIGAEASSAMEQFEKGEVGALDAIGKMDLEKMGNSVAKKHFQLVGIYSGRITVHDEKDPNLGIVWHRRLVDELFSDPHPASHPYPPAPVDD